MKTTKTIWMILTGLLIAGGGSRAGEQPSEPGKSHLLVQVVRDANGFRVERTTLVKGPLPRRRSTRRVTSWRLEVTDRSGEVVHSARLKDPTVLRGEFANPDDPAKIDAVHKVLTGPVHFVIRVPRLAADRIRFQALKPGTERSAEPPADAWEQLGSVRFPKPGE